MIVIVEEGIQKLPELAALLSEMGPVSLVSESRAIPSLLEPETELVVTKAALGLGPQRAQLARLRAERPEIARLLIVEKTNGETGRDALAEADAWTVWPAHGALPVQRAIGALDLARRRATSAGRADPGETPADVLDLHFETLRQIRALERSLNWLAESCTPAARGNAGRHARNTSAALAGQVLSLLERARTRFTASQAGRSAVHRVRVPLDTVVSRAVAEALAAGGAERLDLSLDLCAPLPVLIDDVRLARAISGVLVELAERSSDRVRVTLRTRGMRDRVRLRLLLDSVSEEDDSVCNLGLADVETATPSAVRQLLHEVGMSGGEGSMRADVQTEIDLDLPIDPETGFAINGDLEGLRLSQRSAPRYSA